jgi:predicted HicB family RNase H-like nuclease
VPKSKPNPKNERMIHIRLSQDVHKRLRIRAAELDTSIQEWVAQTVIRELDRQEGRKRSAS